MRKKSHAGSEYSGSYNPIKYSNAVVQEPQFKIIDKKSPNHFGILFTTQKSLEAFQINSGMNKPYSVEYQFHYHALVARIELDGDILDIAIPTVMFNYKQEVSGAAITFHLNDIEAASKECEQLAHITANAIIDSEFGKTIKTFFPNVQWLSVPLNTCHVHPNQLSTFSSTDYDKNANNAGVVFPLSKADKQASFSSILCHDSNNVVKLVRTEYRNATSDENSITYSHGSCFTYVKGYETQLKLLQQIFANKPSIKKHSYTHADGYVNAEDNEIFNALITAFDTLDYEPNTDFVKAENIVRKKYETYSAPFKKFDDTPKGFGKKSLNGSITSTKKSRSINNLFSDDPDYSAYDKVEAMQLECIAAGYAASQVYGWSFAKLKQFHNTISAFNKATSKDLSIEELIKELLALGFDQSEIKGKSVVELQEMYEETLEDILILENETIEENSGYEIIPKEPTIKEWKTDKKAIKFLIKFGITQQEIDEMSEEEMEEALAILNY